MRYDVVGFLALASGVLLAGCGDDPSRFDLVERAEASCVKVCDRERECALDDSTAAECQSECHDLAVMVARALPEGEAGDACLKATDRMLTCAIKLTCDELDIYEDGDDYASSCGDLERDADLKCAIAMPTPT